MGRGTAQCSKPSAFQRLALKDKSYVAVRKRNFCKIVRFWPEIGHLLCRIFKVYVRPIVDTCSATFVLTTKKEVEQLESVQKRFTRAAFERTFPGEDLPNYRERCLRFNLDTLEERQIRSDLILAKKILLGKCATKNRFHLHQSRTRGGATKFSIPFFRTKMRESTFFIRTAVMLSKFNTDFVLNSTLGVFKEFVKDLVLSDVCDLCF